MKKALFGAVTGICLMTGCAGFWPISTGDVKVKANDILVANRGGTINTGDQSGEGSINVDGRYQPTQETKRQMDPNVARELERGL